MFGRSVRWSLVAIEFQDCRFQRLLSCSARSHFRPGAVIGKNRERPFAAITEKWKAAVRGAKSIYSSAVQRKLPVASFKNLIANRAILVYEVIA